LSLAGMRLATGTLICLAAGDRSNQVFHIEIVGDELTYQLVEQFRVAWQVVVGAEAVHRVNQAHAEEVMPQAIDSGAGEPGIVAPDDPLRQRLPRRDSSLPVRFGPIRETRFHPGAQPADLDARRTRLLLARRNNYNRVGLILAQAGEKGGIL